MNIFMVHQTLKIITLVITGVITLFLVMMLSNVMQSTSRKEIKYSEFVQMLEEDKVESVEGTSTVAISTEPFLNKYLTDVAVGEVDTVTFNVLEQSSKLF